MTARLDCAFCSAFVDQWRRTGDVRLWSVASAKMGAMLAATDPRQSSTFDAGRIDRMFGSAAGGTP